MTDSIIIWRVATRVPSEARLAVEEMLEFHCVAVNSFEAEDVRDWIIDGFAIAEPNYQALKLKLSEVLYNYKCDQNIVLEIELVAEQDWLAESLASFPAGAINCIPNGMFKWSSPQGNDHAHGKAIVGA